jgi:hypothetical protein
LVQDRGGAEFQTAGILLYVEDLKRGTNKDIGPKDIFEMSSSYRRWGELSARSSAAVHRQCVRR